MEQKGYRGRTDTYRYIRLNLERYLALGVGTSDGPSWETFAAMLGRENQRNKQGGPISRDSARKIFERASKDARDKKLEMLTGVPQRKQQPSHLPATWRPTPETAPTPATFTARSSRSPPSLSVTARLVRARLRKRSRTYASSSPDGAGVDPSSQKEKAKGNGQLS